MRDIHLLELAKQLRLDFKSHIHLLFPIEGFVRQKEKEKDPWQFRIKEDGTRYWINHEEMVVNFKYPHLEELHGQVEQHNTEFTLGSVAQHLKDFSPFQLLASSPVFMSKIVDCKKATIGVITAKLANGGVFPASL